MFDKVRAVGITFVFTVLLYGSQAGLDFLNTVNWAGFGPSGPFLGLMIGTGGAWFISWFKKEYKGYGTKRNPKLTKDA